MTTLVLTGGPFLILEVPGHPAIPHDGGSTIAHVDAPREVVSEVVAQLRASGVTVLERTAVKEVQYPRGLLSNACATCPWLDSGGGCGMSDNPEDVVTTLMSEDAEMAAAALRCPLGPPHRSLS